MKSKMCFYIEGKWQANPPTPEDPTVFLETSAPMKVYVHRFGGYASTDAVWMKHAVEFSKKMGKSQLLSEYRGDVHR